MKYPLGLFPHFINSTTVLNWNAFHKIPNFDKRPTLGAQSWSPMAARNIVREVYSALSSSEESGSSYNHK